MKQHSAPETLIIAGPQGSGKGTQAQHLIHTYGYDHFEMGGKLREVAKNDDEIGQAIREAQATGRFVDFQVVMQIVENYIGSRGASQRLLFDGIPRDARQEEAFMEKLDAAGRANDAQMVLLDLPKDAAMKNIIFRGVTTGRLDDQDPAVVAKRLEGFYEKTMPVVDKFDRQGRLIPVDARPVIDMEQATEVARRIQELKGSSVEMDDLQDMLKEIEVQLAQSIRTVSQRLDEVLQMQAVV